MKTCSTLRTMAKIARDTLVEITWLDTCTVPGWTLPAEIDKVTPIMAKSVGYYHGCKRIGGQVRWITIKHNTCSDGNADFTVIPFGCVVKMERIE
jgi:hypothetical protein